MKDYAESLKKQWMIIMDIAMKESRNEGGNRMENEIYPIMTEDGKCFASVVMMEQQLN